jgi:hypothetical protein
MIDTSAAMQTRWPESRPPAVEHLTSAPETAATPSITWVGNLNPGQGVGNALSEQITRLYRSEHETTGIVPAHGYAAIPDQTRKTSGTEASAMLQSALCMLIVTALAGCGSATGSARDDRQLLMDEPACYRDTKSEYEAAGASQSPNAAMLKIGASLAARDNALGKCLPAAGENNQIK